MKRTPSVAVAAIDCGSNSTRLLVADGSGATLTRIMQITRLGEGVDATQELGSEAVSRTFSVLASFRTIMDELTVSAGRLVATSAVRDARNGTTFLSGAQEITGLVAELLTGQEEGRLAFSGATADLPTHEGSDLILDIGGGSTELVLGSGNDRIEALSLRLGCVRVSERCFHHDPPTSHELRAAMEVIHDELDRVPGVLPALVEDSSDVRLVGLAGTVSTIAGLELNLLEYDRERVHHSILSDIAIRKWFQKLSTESSATRLQRSETMEGRADVIVGGVAILLEVMARFGFSQCVASECDILDGLVLSILNNS